MLSASGALEGMLGLMNVERKRGLKQPLVSIVDDDASTPKSAQRLICRSASEPRHSHSARNFWSRAASRKWVPHPYRCGCRRWTCWNYKISWEHDWISIIFVTAHASDDQQRRATQAGAVAFLRKPVSEQAPSSAIQAGRRKAVVG